MGPTPAKVGMIMTGIHRQPVLIPGPLNQALECPAGEIRLPKEMDLGSVY